MIPRIAENRIRELAGQFPVVVITGPRQSGKTTLIKAMYPDLPYYNLERPDILERVREDPQGFLSSLKGKKTIIDEAQRFPELTSWIQSRVDEKPEPGQFF
jgi:predicted AAA+ superfamily ATPase